MRWLLIAVMGILVLGCQTEPKPRTQLMKDFDEGSTARGEAYTADSMHFRKAMPDHSDWQPTDFYYKHCSEVGEQYYFSKTSYECSSP